MARDNDQDGFKPMSAEEWLATRYQPAPMPNLKFWGSVKNTQERTEVSQDVPQGSIDEKQGATVGNAHRHEVSDEVLDSSKGTVLNGAKEEYIHSFAHGSHGHDSGHGHEGAAHGNSHTQQGAHGATETHTHTGHEGHDTGHAHTQVGHKHGGETQTFAQVKVESHGTHIGSHTADHAAQQAPSIALASVVLALGALHAAETALHAIQKIAKGSLKEALFSSGHGGHGHHDKHGGHVEKAAASKATGPEGGRF